MDVAERLEHPASKQLENSVKKEFQKEIQALMKQAIKHKEAHTFNTEAARSIAMNVVKARVGNILGDLISGE